MSFNNLTKILNDINTVLLPKVCFGCNARLYRGENQLCTVCRNDLPFTDYSFNEENPIDRIFFGKIPIKKASSFLFYRESGVVQNLIHYLKYRNQEEIGALLGEWYGQLLNHDPGLRGLVDYVVPVPLHPKKQKKRGYNQVTAFSRGLARHLGAVHREDILTKAKDTATQTRKNRLRRIQNMDSMYRLNMDTSLNGKNILLVDDVITTGATMERCAETLLPIPGVSIYITSIAVVPLV